MNLRELRLWLWVNLWETTGNIWLEILLSWSHILWIILLWLIVLHRLIVLLWSMLLYRLIVQLWSILLHRLILRLDWDIIYSINGVLHNSWITQRSWRIIYLWWADLSLPKSLRLGWSWTRFNLRFKSINFVLELLYLWLHIVKCLLLALDNRWPTIFIWRKSSGEKALRFISISILNMGWL